MRCRLGHLYTLSITVMVRNCEMHYPDININFILHRPRRYISSHLTAPDPSSVAEIILLQHIYHSKEFESQATLSALVSESPLC